MCNAVIQIYTCICTETIRAIKLKYQCLSCFNAIRNTNTSCALTTSGPVTVSMIILYFLFPCKCLCSNSQTPNGNSGYRTLFPAKTGLALASRKLAQCGRVHANVEYVRDQFVE